MSRRRFLWTPYNCREEDCRISTSRTRLKKHIKELHPGTKILYEEQNQNFIYLANEDGDDLGSISWVEEI